MAEKKADQMVAKMVGHLAEKTALNLSLGSPRVAKKAEMTAVNSVRYLSMVFHLTGVMDIPRASG
jgi:hypothetical protein